MTTHTSQTQTQLVVKPRNPYRLLAGEKIVIDPVSKTARWQIGDPNDYDEDYGYTNYINVPEWLVNKVKKYVEKYGDKIPSKLFDKVVAWLEKYAEKESEKHYSVYDEDDEW